MIYMPFAKLMVTLDELVLLQIQLRDIKIAPRFPLPIFGDNSANNNTQMYPDKNWSLWFDSDRMVGYIACINP